MYLINQIYQAERPKTEAEQRQIDRVNAELVAACAELWHACAASWHWLRQVALRARRHRKPPTPWHEPGPLQGTETSPDTAPREHAEMCSAAR